MKCIAKHGGRLSVYSETRGYDVIMDAAPPLGQKKGMSPGELLLNSLAGCKVMSLISVAKRENINIEDLTIEITGETGQIDSSSEGSIKGKAFKNIHTIYRIKTPNSKEEVEDFVYKANKLCTVENSLSEDIEKTSEIIIVE